jgi:hypothetical protein
MKCISGNIRNKLSILFGGLSVFCFYHFASSQELSKIYEWEVDDAVDATSDLRGHLYISNAQGVIEKFNAEGIRLLSYSGNMTTPIYSIDVSHTSKIFGFYRDNQSYIILDKFLNPLNEALLNASIVGYATETAYASDNNLWVFDQSDLSIKKINILNDILINEITLSLVIRDHEWEVRQIEEYQNRIYLNNAGGDIYVFDRFGNFIKKLNIQADGSFCFSGEDLIYIEGDGIFKIDLYRNQTEQIARLQDTNHILKVISTNNFIYLVSKNKIVAYK